jgi:DNA-binding ferritin-like protein
MKTKDVIARRKSTLETSGTGTPEARRDVATASLIEGWIDEAETRVWYLFESAQVAENAGS